MDSETHRSPARILILLALSLFPYPAALAADAPAAALNVGEMKFAATPGLPDCAVNAVVQGDPTTGPSIILGRIETGCVVPWHWHTPNEHLMIVSGVAELAMRGGEPKRLEAGGFAMMPSRHVHQFRCVSDCLMYVYSDGIFDTHYVDAGGKEIPPVQALGAVGEKAVPPPG